MPGEPSFSYADLFAGIGGFHALLSHVGGRCVFASEIDPHAVRVYERNWVDGPSVSGDITKIDASAVPAHDVLAAGFPCQAFSKSGLQRGIGEARGTLFYDILRILEQHTPQLILLENVRNLVGPRHRETWQAIVRLLRRIGYRVASEPVVFSPHLLPPELGGAPQARDRVYIVGIYVGPQQARLKVYDEPAVLREPVGDWRPTRWNLFEHLLGGLERGVEAAEVSLSDDEIMWISVWDEFVRRMLAVRRRPLPGFPLWFEDFRLRPRLSSEMPEWKKRFLRANSRFYAENRLEIQEWRTSWRRELLTFPPSRLKLEWQAKEKKSLWECSLQMRPSGIRAKEPTYLPALVAMAQTPVIGPFERRLSTREAARLQGLPDWFEFDGQAPSSTFRQLGNGINVGAAWWVLRSHVQQYRDLLPDHVVEPVLASPPPVAERMARPLRRQSVA